MNGSDKRLATYLSPCSSDDFSVLIIHTRLYLPQDVIVSFEPASPIPAAVFPLSPVSRPHRCNLSPGWHTDCTGDGHCILSYARGTEYRHVGHVQCRTTEAGIVVVWGLWSWCPRTRRDSTAWLRPTGKALRLGRRLIAAQMSPRQRGDRTIRRQHRYLGPPM